MRQMKQSGLDWIDEIPEGWTIERNKLLFREVNDRCVNGDEHTLLSVSEYYGIAPKVDKISESEFETRAESLDGYKLCQIGDIVMNIMLAWKKSTGKSDYNGIVSPAYCVYRPIRPIDTKYYHYLFRTDLLASLFKQHSTGIIDSRLRLYPDEFLSLKMIVPPLVEQKRMAAFLDVQCTYIDNIIEKTKASIEEYKKLKQSIITQAVTKGVRGNRPMKDSGAEHLGNIPEGWICIKIKYVSTITRGVFNHRPRNDERYYNGSYPFIQTGDVSGVTKYITTYNQTLNELGKSVSKLFHKGTITMTIAANVGDVAILGFDAYCPDSIVGIVSNENTLDNYFFYVLSSMKSVFVEKAVSNTQLNLNVERIKDIIIPYTTNYEEQVEIAEYLDKKCADMDKLIANKEQLLIEMEYYKKAMIYEYVTGKKEII